MPKRLERRVKLTDARGTKAGRIAARMAVRQPDTDRRGFNTEHRASDHWPESNDCAMKMPAGRQGEQRRNAISYLPRLLASYTMKATALFHLQPVGKSALERSRQKLISQDDGAFTGAEYQREKPRSAYNKCRARSTAHGLRQRYARRRYDEIAYVRSRRSCQKYHRRAKRRSQQHIIHFSSS